MIFFSVITPVFCIVISLLILARLFIIDLKIRLLPNAWVASFAVIGVLLNLSTNFTFTSPENMIFASLAVMALLLIIRAIANHIYKVDTLGLGDIKLMGAAGLWLGSEYIFLSLSLGAFLGLAHGIIYALITNKGRQEKVPLSNLTIPAGPGLISGIIICAVIKFQQLPDLLGLL